MNELKYAARQLVRQPVLTVIVIAMLAIGIGATTAMFSWVNALLLQSLPAPAAEQLVNLGAPGPKPGSHSCSFSGDCEQVFSYPMFRDLEAQQTVFTGMAGHAFFRANLAYEGRTLASGGTLVTGQYFNVLGLTPALGRFISPADEPAVGESAVVVLSHEYWQSGFGGAADVIGQTLTVNGHALTIIGVAPDGFSGTTIGAKPTVFVPMTLRWLMQPTIAAGPESRLAYWMYVFARLRPGVSLEQARAGINSLYGGILNEVEAPLNDFLPPNVMELFRERQITVAPGARGQSEIPNDAQEPLTLLLGLTGLVLLIVCVNIANLLLARGASRTGEFAIRASLGAGRRNLLAQSLTEATLLAAIGGVCSLPVAHALLAGIRAMLPTVDVGAGFDIELNATALVFAGSATIATVLLFGILPALKAMQVSPGSVVKGQAAQAAASHAMSRFRSTLAGAQIAFSMLLLALAGMFAQSLANVSAIDLGLDVESVVAFNVSPRLSGYDNARATAVYDRIEDALGNEPGILRVTSARVPIIANNNSRNSLTVAGFDAEPTDDTTASLNEVSASYFATLGIPLLAGRALEPTDSAGRPRVAVVNQSFLEKFDLGMDAVGTRFAQGSGDGTVPDIEIVGIVADSRYSSVKAEIPPQYFLSRHQNDNIGTLTFYVRGATNAEALYATVRRVVGSIDASLPVGSLMTMEQTVDDNLFLDRMVAIFSAAFAAVATLLAAVGLYGVLAYGVAQRTRELGVRLALGATPSRLRAMVLKQVGLIALIAIPAGLVAAVFTGRLAASLLFGLSPADPAVLTGAAAILICCVAAAGILPARRAARVEPMAALRYD